jgi:hypothetical protein
MEGSRDTGGGRHRHPAVVRSGRHRLDDERPVVLDLQRLARRSMHGDVLVTDITIPVPTLPKAGDRLVLTCGR